MILMLRHLGIPARMINGFQPGEYNPISKAWTVRQYNAHSWVEAWLAPYGWVQFDPTPPEPRQEKSFFQTAMGNLTDALDLWWWNGVVRYDLMDQYRVAMNARATTALVINEAKASAASLLKFGRIKSSYLFSAGPVRTIAVLLLVCGCGIYFLAKLGLWKRVRKLRLSRKSDSTRLAQAFYSEALELLARHGHARKRGQTPGELAASLKDHPAFIPFSALTDIYHRARFGHEPEPELRKKTGTLLKSLKSSLKQI
jgi:hypothetical protein